MLFVDYKSIDTDLGYHLWLHEKDWRFDLQHFMLECPICCGLPPWEWTAEGIPTSWDVVPSVEMSEWDDRRIKNKILHGRKGKYIVSFTIFGQRRDRGWRRLDYPMDFCRVCGDWKRVARHRLGYSYNLGGRPKSICLKCARKETKQLNQKSLKDIINMISPTKKRRTRNEQPA